MRDGVWAGAVVQAFRKVATFFHAASILRPLRMRCVVLLLGSVYNMKGLSAVNRLLLYPEIPRRLLRVYNLYHGYWLCAARDRRLVFYGVWKQTCLGCDR